MEIFGQDFRVERPNEVARRFARADIRITSDRLLVITDSEDGHVLCVYNADWWEALIFGENDA